MLLALLIAAQAVEAPPASLAPFKPFLGSCWRASFSATTTDTHCSKPCTAVLTSGTGTR